MQHADHSALSDLLAQLGETLAVRGLKLVTAESCTGGWIAKVLTDPPGSSVYMDAGLVTYSNSAKQLLLGVSSASLEQFGAVSGAVAGEMAEGALAATEADIAISVTGVAGPGGGSAEKPVGTVWFGWCRRGHRAETTCEHFSGDRDVVRYQAVLFALEGLKKLLERT